MCYYNGQKVTHTEFIRLKGIEKLVRNYDFLDRGVVQGFPYGNTAILKRKPGVEDFDIVQMEWGMIPDDWYGKPIETRADVNLFRFGDRSSPNKNFREPKLALNFIGEEIMMNGKKFKDSALHNRCLMLSTGFFEWHHYYPVNKRTGLPNKTVSKIPYFITLKNQPYFYFPAIWKPWTDKETGEYVETVANGTTTAKEHKMMEWIHNSKERMPTILTEDQAWEWMFGDLTEQRITELSTSQYPMELMEAWPADKDFKMAEDPSKLYIYGEDVPSLEKYLRGKL
jgi:putative SOS response-associated peptidase YedK